MSFGKLGRRWLRRVVFHGRGSHLAQMRVWALVGLTSLLATIWKLLIQLDKLYSDDFWRTVFGHDPVNKLGQNGFLLLILYVLGAGVWWVVTVLLLEMGKIWGRRVGLQSA
jgi:hypothetical protein